MLEVHARPGFAAVVQDIFMKRSGIEWIVKDIEASHSAYVRKSARVGACFRRDVCLKEMGFTTNAASVTVIPILDTLSVYNE